MLIAGIGHARPRHFGSCLRNLFRKGDKTHHFDGGLPTALPSRGFQVSARTVAKYMRVYRCRGQTGTWREFLTRHASDIWACGFFCVPTILFQTLHVFFVIRLANREIRKIAARHLCSAGYTIFTGLLHDAFLRPAGILGVVQPGLHQFGGSQSVGTRIVFVG